MGLAPAHVLIRVIAPAGRDGNHKPGGRGHLSYRMRAHRGRKGERRSMSEADHAGLIAAARNQLAAPVRTHPRTRTALDVRPQPFNRCNITCHGPAWRCVMLRRRLERCAPHLVVAASAGDQEMTHARPSSLEDDV